MTVADRLFEYLLRIQIMLLDPAGLEAGGVIQPVVCPRVHCCKVDILQRKQNKGAYPCIVNAHHLMGANTEANKALQEGDTRREASGKSRSSVHKRVVFLNSGS